MPPSAATWDSAPAGRHRGAPPQAHHPLLPHRLPPIPGRPGPLPGRPGRAAPPRPSPRPGDRGVNTDPGGPRPETGFPDDLVALHPALDQALQPADRRPQVDGHELHVELLRLGFHLDAHPHWVSAERAGAGRPGARSSTTRARHPATVVRPAAAGGHHVERVAPPSLMDSWPPAWTRPVS